MKCAGQRDVGWPMRLPRAATTSARQPPRVGHHHQSPRSMGDPRLTAHTTMETWWQWTDAVDHRRLVQAPRRVTSASARPPPSASIRVTVTIQMTCIDSTSLHQAQLTPVNPLTAEDAAARAEPGLAGVWVWPARRSRLHQLDMHAGQGPAL
jgi:hypothetical protein